MLAFTVIVGYVNAQTLSVQDVEVQAGEKTELVLNLTGGTAVTALQFNLKLPDGFRVHAGSAFIEADLNRHVLSVETLDTGDFLFVLYRSNLRTFKDGELLRIPITAGNSSTTATGQLYNVRTATADAVSHTCEDATFRVTVNGAYTLGDVNGDGSISVTDVTMVISHILGQTPDGFNKDAADINGDGDISVTDVTMIIGIILGNPTTTEKKHLYTTSAASYEDIGEDDWTDRGEFIDGMQIVIPNGANEYIFIKTDERDIISALTVNADSRFEEEMEIVGPYPAEDGYHYYRTKDSIYRRTSTVVYGITKVLGSTSDSVESVEWTGGAITPSILSVNGTAKLTKGTVTAVFLSGWTENVTNSADFSVTGGSISIKGTTYTAPSTPGKYYISASYDGNTALSKLTIIVTEPTEPIGERRHLYTASGTSYESLTATDWTDRGEFIDGMQIMIPNGANEYIFIKTDERDIISALTVNADSSFEEEMEIVGPYPAEDGYHYYRTKDSIYRKTTTVVYGIMK